MGNSKEIAILVGIQHKENPSWEVNDNLDELEQLAHTAGAIPEIRVVQGKGSPVASTLISKGKVTEIKSMISFSGASIVIFDDDLSPAQVKNLGKKLEVKIIDRAGLILDIFAKRAQTHEARIQVELAQLEYLLPRLTGQWKHLSRQFGGIGTRGPSSSSTAGAARGPGETQLEMDRRVVNRKISKLKKYLKKIEKGRATRRKRRSDLFKVALIGYTNAGKSTILNGLTNAKVFVENLLFATLDPTVRALRLPDGKRALLIDTVGFIRKLPVGLFASFKSTLEESISSDLMINVVDLAHPHWEEQYERTEEIVKQLKLHETPQILVFNKVDLVKDLVLLDGLRNQFPEALFISALRGIRLYELPERIAQFVNRQWTRGRQYFSPEEANAIKVFESKVKVIGRSFNDGKIVIDYLREG